MSARRGGCRTRSTRMEDPSRLAAVVSAGLTLHVCPRGAISNLVPVRLCTAVTLEQLRGELAPLHAASHNARACPWNAVLISGRGSGILRALQAETGANLGKAPSLQGEAPPAALQAATSTGSCAGPSMSAHRAAEPFKRWLGQRSQRTWTPSVPSAWR